MGMMNQGGIAKFDRKTQKFQTWNAPKFMENNEARLAMVDPVHFNRDGKVWIGGDNEYQLDVQDRRVVHRRLRARITSGGPPANRLSSYGVSQIRRTIFTALNLDGQFHHQGRCQKSKRGCLPDADAKFGSTTRPHRSAGSSLVRGVSCQQDRHVRYQRRANPGVGCADPWTNPYDAIVDKAGYAWTGGMTNDYIVRVNTKTNETVGYLFRG